MESPSVEPVSKEKMPEFLAQMEKYAFQMDSLGTMGHFYRYLDVLK
jgi:hypothetical protein